MYVPLNIKTDNYLQSSMIKINDLISYALKHDLKALTITDNNLYGAIDFYKACKNNNIKFQIFYPKNQKIMCYFLLYKNYYCIYFV